MVGAAIVATRFAVAEVAPLTLAMLRYAIGFVCLLPFAVHAMRAGPTSRSEPVASSRGLDFAAMAALGIGQFAVLIALLNYGLQHVGAAQAALIFSLFPLLTLCLAALLGRERVSLQLFSGVLISIVGVGVALAPKLSASLNGNWWGELAVLGSAATGALCSVLYRPYLQRYPTVPVSAFSMLASVVFLALFALTEAWPSRVGSLSGLAWGAIAFIGVASGVGYFWWLYALKHESPTRVTIFLALNPPVAGLLGWALLGEPLHAASWGAMALIATGLWLATRPAPARTR